MKNTSRWQAENGAIMVFVAIAMIVLIGFLTFVFDYGILWVSRSQAQAAADAGALSGAISRTYDDQTNPPPPGGVVENAAIRAALNNEVWNGSAGEQVAEVDRTYTCPTGISGSCVRVNVYRNGELGSSILPIFFGKVLGITTHGVRATATARSAAGNATNCLRPFALPDRWIDDNMNEVYDIGEEYRPPTHADPTGYNLDDDLGSVIQLKDGGGSENDLPTLTPGWFRLLDVGHGGSSVEASIRGCVGLTYKIGDVMEGESGGKTGPVRMGVEDLVALGSGDWNEEYKRIDNDCVTTHTCYRYTGDPDHPTLTPDPGATINPRIVPIAVFDPKIFVETGQLVLVNILGFFIQGMTNSKDLSGYLITKPDLLVSDAGNINNANSFIRVIQLVR